jgi:hypothetical protein
VPPAPHDLQSLRAGIARAAKAHRANPSTVTAADLDRLRVEYREAVLAHHVRRALSAAPPLTDAQRRRIASLLVGGAE